jgi:heme exporter protein A
MLELINVSKKFGYYRVWENINLSLQPGDVCALFGRNGAGKSTLLKCIAGLSKYSSGKMNYFAPNGSDRVLQGRVGLLGHASMLYGDLTALENLKFTAGLYKLQKGKAELLGILKDAGLGDWAEIPVKTFSRGMTQRLALCKTLLTEPELALLDEPFTGLDEGAIHHTQSLIAELQAKKRIIVLVTHDLLLGYEAANKLFILSPNQNRMLNKAEISYDAFRKLVLDAYEKESL